MKYKTTTTKKVERSNWSKGRSAYWENAGKSPVYSSGELVKTCIYFLGRLTHCYPRTSSQQLIY